MILTYISIFVNIFVKYIVIIVLERNDIILRFMHIKSRYHLRNLLHSHEILTRKYMTLLILHMREHIPTYFTSLYKLLFIYLYYFESIYLFINLYKPLYIYYFWVYIGCMVGVLSNNAILHFKIFIKLIKFSIF